jgi:hypothetical protein
MLFDFTCFLSNWLLLLQVKGYNDLEEPLQPTVSVNEIRLKQFSPFKGLSKKRYGHTSNAKANCENIFTNKPSIAFNFSDSINFT